MRPLFGRTHREATVSREPTETYVNTITVDCGRTGPEYVIEYDTYRQYSLADVEAWCTELRRLGARDDLPLEQAEGLTVTMDFRPRTTSSPALRFSGGSG